jgi:hypothetical protein
MTYNIRIMQWVRQAIPAVCALGVVFTATAEQRPLDTYKSIVDRNPFGLKDPPAAVVKPETNAAPVKKEDFYLTGISTIGNPNRPKVYLVSKDATKKQYDEKFFNLTLGDRTGELTLNEVDVKGRRVRITYQGEDKWLSMKENGVPAPAGPAPGAPGAPGMMPPGSVVPPGVNPVPLPNGNGGPNQIPQPQPLSYPNANNLNRRSVRTSGAPTYQGPQSDSEMLKHIIEAQNQQKLNPPQNLPKGVPLPPMPGIVSMPGQ